MKKKPSPRFHRSEPHRREPDRGSSAGTSGKASERHRPTSHEWDDDSDESPYDWAGDGMRAANRVVEEHLRSRRHGQGWYEPRSGQSPFGYRFPGGRGEGTIEQMMRLYLDLMNFVVSMISAGPLGRSNQYGGGDRYPSPEQHRHDHVTQVSIEMVSTKTTRSKLDLEAPRHARLSIRPLDAIDPELPSIDEVSIRIRHHRPTLRIVVPEGQPDGVYTGAIVDAETGDEEYGMLTVRVGDPDFEAREE
jgi:hypothetical protein